MVNELVAREGQAMTAADIRAQVNLIQEIMREVMQKDQHYGVIPGCGNKPTLLKSGAEKLSMVFHLRPTMNNEGDVKITQFDHGHREVMVYCHVLNMAGVEMATGVGSCSTLESKYRYRGGEKKGTGNQTPKDYWNLKNEGKVKEAQDLIGGPGFGVAKVDGYWQICEIGEKAENPDIADVYNTVLKIAKKRAYVDGILSATGASDIFTQDIEDYQDDNVARAPVSDNGKGKPPVDMPKAKADIPQEVPFTKPADDPTVMTGLYISHAERNVTKKDKTQSPVADYVVDKGDEFIKVTVWGVPLSGLKTKETVLRFSGISEIGVKGEIKLTAKEVSDVTAE